MAAKAQTLSIIIPVYNEQDYIGLCLEAISKQSVMPDKVFVVDNNCHDQTVAIARRYPFVSILREKKPGQSWARNKGFDASKTDLLARIDADTILTPDWVKTVKQIFDEDKELAAVTGPGNTALLPGLPWPRGYIGSWLYFLWSVAYYGNETLWGSNMALRKTAWHSVKSKTATNDHKYHEDIDLALLLLKYGFAVKRSSRLRVSLSRQSYLYLPQVLHYMKKAVATKKRLQKDKLMPSPSYNLPYRILLLCGLIIPAIIFYCLCLLAWPIMELPAYIRKRA